MITYKRRASVAPRDGVRATTRDYVFSSYDEASRFEQAMVARGAKVVPIEPRVTHTAAEAELEFWREAQS